MRDLHYIINNIDESLIINGSTILEYFFIQRKMDEMPIYLVDLSPLEIEI